MRTGQNYAQSASQASSFNPTAYHLVTILFNDHLHQQLGTVNDWYGSFKVNVYDVLPRFGFNDDQIEYVLRSRQFCDLVKPHLAQA